MSFLSHIPIVVNAMTIGFLVMAILVLYMLGRTLANTFVNLTPRTLGRLSAFLFLLGFLIPWLIMGDATMILFTFVMTVVMGIMFILKARSSRKRQKEMKRYSRQLGGERL